MEEFFISTTITPDLIKRYIDSIWKIISKKFKRVKIYRIFASILILLSFIFWGYDFYCYITYIRPRTTANLLSTGRLLVAIIMLTVFLINYKYVALRKPLKILKKNTGCQVEYFFKADSVSHRSIAAGMTKELNIDDITNVIIKDDMILFLTGDKKNLACPVLIDIKQLTSEELEQINSYIDLFLYDIIC